MSGFARGVADAMLEGRVAGASSAAAHAAAEAEHARSMQRQSEAHAERVHEKWKKYTRELEEVLKERTAQTSGALVVIDAFMKAIETETTPIQRERIRQAVVSKARNRILELDEKNKSDPGRSSIADNFRKLPTNQEIGVI